MPDPILFAVHGRLTDGTGDRPLPDIPLEISIAGQVLNTGTDRDGRYRVTFRVPAGTAPQSWLGQVVQAETGENAAGITAAASHPLTAEEIKTLAAEIPLRATPQPGERSFTILGRIRDRDPDQDVARLKVEAWDKDTSRDDLLDATLTDSDGTYRLAFDHGVYQGHESERLPDLYLRVYSGTTLVKSTGDKIIKDLPEGEHEIDLEVDLSQVPILQAPELVVSGRVLTPDGQGVAGVRVSAFDRDPRRADLQLGNAVLSGEDGSYEIRYSAEALKATGKVQADLLVRSGETGSPLILFAKPDQRIDLVVQGESYLGPSEYERVHRAIAPLIEGVEPGALLAREPRALAELVAYLSGKGGAEPMQTAYYLRSRALAQGAGVAPAALYGLFRQGLPTHLPALVAADEKTLTRALERARRDNTVSAQDPSTGPEALLQRLPQLAAHQSEAFACDALLRETGLGENQRRRFIERYREHSAQAVPTAQFWEALRLDDGPQDAAIGHEADPVAQLQLTLQLGALTANHPPLVRAIQQAGIASLRELAGWTAQDWVDRIGQSGLPEGIPGDGPREQAINYTSSILCMLEDAFPTAVIAHCIEPADFAGAADLRAFLLGHPDYDLAGSGTDLPEGLENKLAEPLHGLRRLFRVAPRYGRYPVMRRLMRDGLTSAHAIRRRGRAVFAAAYAGPFGRERAEQVWANADQAVAMADTLFGRHAPAMQGAACAAVPAAGEIPDYQALFGPPSLCECEHCRSVYGPAAYLVDLLHFLQGRGGAPDAYQRLTARRPDLPLIELTCANTDTRLPYTDLVNEILEAAVAGGTPAAHQTTLEEAALDCRPEHLDPAAYEQLAQAVHPWSLPFDPWAEEIRSWLEHLGVQRRELMETLGGATAVQIACETLGTDPGEWEILAGLGKLAPALYWGLEPGPDWEKELQPVSRLLERSGLAPEALPPLLETAYINPDGALQLLLPTGCDPDQATLAGLDAAALDRLHRFTRLQRRLGWSSAGLDTVLTALGRKAQGDPLDEALLIRIAELRRLQELVDTPVRTMAAWWAPMDTRTRGDTGSLYREVFLDPKLDTGGSDPLGLEEAEARPCLLAALGLGEQEWELLRERLGGENPLDLESLSALYRAVSLAAALELSVADYLSLCALYGYPALAPCIPETTLAFVTAAHQVRDSGFDIAELDYLLRHRFPTESALAPDMAAVTILLGELRSGLKQIGERYPEADDTALRARTRALLAELIPREADLQRAVAIVEGVLDETPADPQALTPAGGTENSLELMKRLIGAFLTEQMLEILGSPLQDPGEGEDPEQTIQAQITTRYRILYEPLRTYLSRRAGESLLVQRLGEALGLEADATRRLLCGLLPALDAGGRHAVDDFLTDAFISGNGEILASGPHAPLFHHYHRLHKITRLVAGFGLETGEVAWLCTDGPAFGCLDPRTLPLEPQGRGSRLGPWLTTATLHSLHGRLPADEPPLRETLDNPSGLVETVARRTGWPADDIQTLIGGAAPQNRIALLERIARLFRLTGRLGLFPAGAADLARSPATPAAAEAARLAARAKYRPEQWPAVAAPVQDRLRERRRQALVNYLTHHSAIGDAEDLYAHFLIDVEMTPALTTSRIKQAIASVQLFVQRALMGLEPGLELTPEDAREWDWMKHYRVWEANRKVFLYPENWIEPELRDDKSPFFEELEQELLQQEVTDQAVKEALRNYLERLHRVGRLEICGLYHERGERGQVLHLFGRSFGTPKAHFYRRRVDDSHWTPWEPLELDIDSGHLVPFALGGRLYLFWPAFRETASGAPGNGEAAQFFEIGMSWSEYRNGRWSPPRSSQQAIVTAPDLHSLWPDPQDYFIRTRVEDGDLLLDCRAGTSPQGLSCLAGTFRFDGVELEAFSSGAGILDRPEMELLPPGSQVSRQQYREKRALRRPLPDLPLELPAGEAGGPCLRDGTLHRVPVLDATPERFGLLCPHQHRHFLSQTPFIYQDRRRSFFVVPSTVYRERDWVFRHPWWELRHITPEAVSIVPALYRWIPPLERPFDPGPIDFPDPFDRPRAMAAARYSGPEAAEPLGPDELGPEPELDVDLEDVIDIFDGADIVRESMDRLPDEIGPLRLIHKGLRVEGEEGPGWSKLASAWAAGCLRRERPLVAGPAFVASRSYRFEPFDHPYVPLFLRQVARYGVSGLLDPEPGQLPDGRPLQDETDAYFDRPHGYAPGDSVEPPYPVDEVDFAFGGAYAGYNWELFFHLPLLVATRLSANQRFAEAQSWFHAIFDPTRTAGPGGAERFWKLRPFRELAADPSLQALLGGDGQNPELRRLADRLVHQVAEWRHAPFRPHLIARLRPTAYQKTVVMKYIDNLLAWGDHLFRRDTLESLNEATQLYVLAAQLLGERPSRTPAPAGTPSVDGEPVRCFADLAPHLDAFSNALVRLEGALPPLPQAQVTAAAAEPAPLLGPTFFFCFPDNQVLLDYWDRVADRLFKIRHGLDIEGRRRELRLWEPPIEPGLLVRAVAMGLDIDSVLDELYAPLPHYRFAYMLPKALELCADVKALGAALLAALEKQDAERLAQLRSGHEVQLLKLLRETRKLQVKEARAALEAARRGKAMAEKRLAYYAGLPYTNAHEQEHLDQMQTAENFRLSAEQLSGAASVASSVWTVLFGNVGEKPTFQMETGGKYLAMGLNAIADSHTSRAAQRTYQATRAAQLGAYDRRRDDWRHQADLAGAELAMHEKQILAAEIRLALAERELGNLEQQLDNAREVDDFMHRKFTNRKLYGWMVSRISALYFQSYKLACDLARQAERCYRHETGETDSGFIRYGHWDSLKKGLLAGEQLQLDLRRMELARLEHNRREYELTRHVSLALLDPRALLQLRETGRCDFALPEALFDLDYPGHYLRRIKSVRLTLPCVAGPFSNVSATLTLRASRIRTQASTNDDALEERIGGLESIATSDANNDNGLFEFNFRDERYLPFEGAGAVSDWSLELPERFRAFDYDTITDLVLHLDYTAREGGEPFKAGVLEELKSALADGRQPLFQLFSARQDFPDQWQRCLHPAQGEEHTLELELDPTRLPALFRGAGMEIEVPRLWLLFKTEQELEEPPETIVVRGPSSAEWEPYPGDPLLGCLPNALVELEDPQQWAGGWTIGLPEELVALTDLCVLTEYRVKVSD